MEIELTNAEEIVLAAAVLALLASWVARIWLFARDHGDPVLNSLLEDTYPTTADLLPVHLTLRWRKLSATARKEVLPFVLLSHLAVFLLLCVFASSLMRHFSNA